jgi:hypothetical protein
MSIDRVGCVKRTNCQRWCVSPTLQLAVWLGCVLLTAFFTGCSRGDRGPERVVVSGIVTYKGQPIPDGAIQFAPSATSAAPMSGALIADGKYKVDAHGGVPVGTHKIRIEAFRQVKVTRKPGQFAPPNMSEKSVTQQYLPKKHNAETQLEMTIPPGSRAITKNFDLTD